MFLYLQNKANNILLDQHQFVRYSKIIIVHQLTIPRIECKIFLFLSYIIQIVYTISKLTIPIVWISDLIVIWNSLKSIHSSDAITVTCNKEGEYLFIVSSKEMTQIILKRSRKFIMWKDHLRLSQLMVYISSLQILEIEGPWRQKCATLERQILELQIQLRKGGLPQVETIEVIDDTKVKELEKRASELRDQLKKSDAEVEDYNEQIRQLQMQLEESGQINSLIYEFIRSSKITYLTSEVDTWKKKFTSLNKEYNTCQEELMMVQAQLESLQKQQSSGGGGVQTVTRTTVKKGSKFIQQ